MELLLTAPITDLQVVLGKFLSRGFVLRHPVDHNHDSHVGAVPLRESRIGPDSHRLSRAVCSMVWRLLAIGLFISTLTENQIIAAVLTFGTIMVLWLVNVVASRAEGPVTKAVLTYLSVLSHLDDFFKGVLVSSHIIFYLSLTFVALFLTYRSFDSLRWRG